MDYLLREFKHGDEKEVISVFKDANNPRRISKGGIYPDEKIDQIQNWSDEKIKSFIIDGNFLFVVEIEETNEIIGTGGISTGATNFLFKSTHSRAHYVKENYQKKKAGISFGKMLREATISKAASLGFRKIFGYAAPNVIGFHKKFGAKAYPKYNKKSPFSSSVELQYYEIELYDSIWNGWRIEPYIHKISKM
ncbi:hypothetical protein KKE92_06270 [Candidatus Micrarchaeota archaeon]|nr:hypothetical protein [Candidatus Micrarchaeota archaeon]MBU1681949.1 hypothetical protein [Candidatus Micrarchaeota archaeon]